MSDRPGNQTPDTPDLRETDLRRMKVDELRDVAKDEGVGAASRMRKDDLVSAISQAHREAADDAGVLRFDFGEHTDRLREISWDEWFETFDTRGLNFIYQEKRSDGRRSTFFRLENPTREDA